MSRKAEAQATHHSTAKHGTGARYEAQRKCEMFILCNAP